MGREKEGMKALSWRAHIGRLVSHAMGKRNYGPDEERHCLRQLRELSLQPAEKILETTGYSKAEIVLARKRTAEKVLACDQAGVTQLDVINMQGAVGQAIRKRWDYESLRRAGLKGMQKRKK